MALGAGKQQSGEIHRTPKYNNNVAPSSFCFSSLSPTTTGTENQLARCGSEDKRNEMIIKRNATQNLLTAGLDSS